MACGWTKKSSQEHSRRFREHHYLYHIILAHTNYLSSNIKCQHQGINDDARCMPLETSAPTIDVVGCDVNDVEDSEQDFLGADEDLLVDNQVSTGLYRRLCRTTQNCP